MLPKNINTWALLLALAFAGIVGANGYDSWLAITQKAETQATATQAFQKWKLDYSTLLPIDDKWKAELHVVTDAKDLLSVYELVGSELGINADTLIVDKFEVLTANEQLLDGVAACLSSSTGAGVIMEAPNFDELLTNLHAVLLRSDIRIGTIRLSQEKGKAHALLGNFCLLLRNN
jgi:hypothetical protein